MVTQRKGPPTNELADEYLGGSTTVSLAKKYKMSPAAVNRRLTRAGIAMRAARRGSASKTTEDAATKIVAAYKSGESSADVGSRFGVGRSSVMRMVAKAGVTTRRNGTRSRSVTLPTEPLKIGYLAGLFDGEGNLQFRNKRTWAGAETMGCKISIYSTVPAVMGWLTANIGGKARWDYKRQEVKGWLPIGIWEVYRFQDVLVLLELLLPHLLVKKKQAIKAIKFLRDRC
jgi:hypothetical protein